MKITICGSISFYEQIESIRDELVKLGHAVKIPELANEVDPTYGSGKKINFDQCVNSAGGMDNFPAGHEIWDLKENAINEHIKKIEWCDGILVVNLPKRDIEGYVGGNTLIEIGIGFYLKKKIFILNQVSSEISYKQEILGMKPIIINNDFSMLR